MKNLLSLTTLFAVAVALCGCQSAKSPCAEVDPFLGVDGGGNVLPGPCHPFSLVRINPLVELPHPTNGYETGRPIVGFVQTNVSGTGGGGRYGNFLVTPQLGEIDVYDKSTTLSEETSQVGYYSALLDRWGIRAELTSTPRVGVQRFTFPAGGVPHILITASSVIDLDRNYPYDARCVDARIEAGKDGTVSGYAQIIGGWGHMEPYKLYFCGSFDKPYAVSGVWDSRGLLEEAQTARDSIAGAYFSFPNLDGDSITLKIGVSTSSLARARANLQEQEDKSFEQIRAASEAAWDDYLGRIRVEGGTPEQRKIFYTSLYRSFVMPTDITGENPGWTTSEPSYWDFYCLWDTFRCTFPLYSIIAPDKYVEMVRSLLDVYKNRGWLPDAWIVGGFSKQQGGTNADNIIADAVVKGLEGFDRSLALEAMLHNAETPADESDTFEDLLRIGKHRDYIEMGYVPSDKLCCSSYTLEFAYNDFCLYQVASALGKEGLADKYLKRSMNCYNLFDPATGFFWAKDRQGAWVPGFIPTYQGNPWWKGPYFYEGTPYHYSTYVLHDINGLISRHGGKKRFAAYLDEFFDGGFFTHENEPDIHAPYLYNYVGQPWRTAEIVRDIMANQYRTERDGWPGNDDSGTLSSWYVFSSMGLYPITGQDFYLIGSPLFRRIDIALPGDKRFTILAKGVSAENKYIQRATLNGEPYDKSWIRHADIVQGGELVFAMGPSPSEWATKCVMPKSASQIINK